MRTFELRVYKLRTKEALDFYMEQIYPVISAAFRCSGLEAHGFWTAKEDVEPRFFGRASYAAGEEPGEVVRRHMQSREFAEDIRNFHVSDIVGVESRILIPSTSSPLK
jgi:NIPSNAP